MSMSIAQLKPPSSSPAFSSLPGVHVKLALGSIRFKVWGKEVDFGGTSTCVVARILSYVQCILWGPGERPHIHKDPTNHGFWHPPCLAPLSHNVGSLSSYFTTL